MDLYGKKGKSIPQKLMLTCFEILVLLISYWILFGNGYYKIFRSPVHDYGNPARHLLILIFNLIVFSRVCITMFYLIKRQIPWAEAFSIPFAFAIYYIGFALLGFKTRQPIDFIDVLGMVLFVLGSFLNTGSELMRDAWKKLPGNKGKLYTRGLFKYAMHINYFGDILWVMAYAIITRNWYSGLIPIYLFLFFAFYNIPLLDKHLASKYNGQFDEYKAKTKRLVPFIY